MRIRAQELRKLIREELRRSMREADDMPIPIAIPTTTTSYDPFASQPATSQQSKFAGKTDPSAPIEDPDEIRSMINNMLRNSYKPRILAVWSRVTMNDNTAKSNVTMSFTVLKDGTVDPNTVTVTCTPDPNIGEPDSTGYQPTLCSLLTKTVKGFKFRLIASDTPINYKIALSASD